MDTKKYQPLLVGLMCITLGACSSIDKHSAMDGTDNASTTATAPAATASANEAPAMPASGTDTSASSAAMTWSGVVQNIEMVPRSSASGTSTDSASGSSGTANTMGAPNDIVYRISLRMEDGTSKTAVQDIQPSFQIGDKVRITNGMLQRY